MTSTRRASGRRSGPPKPQNRHVLGLPDWRDASAYPGEDAPSDEWRWEFLRRRPDYRKAWLTQAKAKASQQSDGPLKRFGLMQMVNPSLPYKQTASLLVFPQTYGFRLADATPETLSMLDMQGQVAIVFDYSLPFADQARMAERVFREGQRVSGIKATLRPRGRKPHAGYKRLWARSLRVLDARDSGLSLENIYLHILSVDLSKLEYDALMERGMKWSSGWASRGAGWFDVAIKHLFTVSTTPNVDD